MANNIQRNIIIGADAQQFYDAMRGINNQISHVDATLKQMDKSQMRNVASGHLLSQAIQDIGRAFVQYIQGAVEKAQKLPPGLYDSVDALRDARKEAEAVDIAFGAMASGGVAKATKAVSNFKAALLGAEMSGGFNATDPLGWTRFFTDFKENKALGKEMVALINDQIEKEKKLQEQQEESRKARAALDKMAKYRADQAEKAARQAEKDYKQLQESNIARREEIGLMLEYNRIMADADKARNDTNRISNDPYGNTNMLPLEDIDWSVFEEMKDAAEFLEFITEMLRFKDATDAANKALLKQQAIIDFVGGAFNDMFYTALISGKDFFQQMGQWVENYIKRLAAAAAAAAALTIITGGSGGGFMGIFSKLIGLPKLAHGGVVNKATPLIAGEAGPEAIIPLNKLGSMGGNLSARISGRDLLLLLEREQTLKNRVYG